jgi:hypothetical protein
VTIDEPDAELLDAVGLEVGQAIGPLLVGIVHETLEAARGESGAINAASLQAVLRLIRGEDPQITEPRWRWPLDALLEDARWWDRWLPSFNELLGRGLGYRERKGVDRPGRAPVLDQRGYSDLMAFLFPIVEGISWRSSSYGEAIGAERAAIWEAVLRHVALALTALEWANRLEADPLRTITTQEQITGPWLKTLRRLLGVEGSVDRYAFELLPDDPVA